MTTILCFPDYVLSFLYIDKKGLTRLRYLYKKKKVKNMNNVILKYKRHHSSMENYIKICQKLIE